MRLFSLLPMILAAIFFAGSVSADHKCSKSKKLGAKVYQVCKSWRVDQGGPMPTNMMQHCRNVLYKHSEDRYKGYGTARHAVDDVAREKAKAELGYW